MARHSNTTTRMTESLSTNRRNVSKQVIKQWFADIRSYLAEKDYLDILYVPKCNFNFDEFQFLLKAGKIFAERGSKKCFLCHGR